jgi:hypothetical protein
VIWINHLIYRLLLCGFRKYDDDDDDENEGNCSLVWKLSLKLITIDEALLGSNNVISEFDKEVLQL